MTSRQMLLAVAGLAGVLGFGSVTERASSDAHALSAQPRLVVFEIHTST